MPSMMLDTQRQLFRTSCRHSWIQPLLFSRETLVIRPPASAEVDLGSDNDVTTAEFEFLNDATAKSNVERDQEITSDDRLKPTHHVRKYQGDLQLELGASLAIRLGGVEHVYSVVESDLDDLFGGISLNRTTDGEP